MLRVALALAVKDLRLFVRDRTALFFAILLPIGLASVMGTALGGNMGGGSGGTPTVGLAVEDRDGSAQSLALIEDLVAEDGLRVDVVQDARRLVADGDRAGGLVIPEGYGAALDGGATPPELALYRDPARRISSQLVLFKVAPPLFQRMAGSMGSGLMPRVLDALDFPAAGRAEAEEALRASYDRMDALTARLEADGAFADAAAEDVAESDPDAASPGGFDVQAMLPGLLGLSVEDLAPEREDGLPRSAGASHAFAAMAVMMLLFNLVAAAGTLQDERAEGTIDRLRLTPSAGRAVLTGKMLVTMTLAGAQLVILFAFGAVAFDVPVLQHLPELALASLVWAFAASAMGLLFATAARTRKQMEGLSTLVILGMSAVGGAWFPREITPEWFQTVGLATPVAWAMDAYHGVLWYGKGVLAGPERGGIAVSLLVLLGAGALMLAVSARLYRSRFGSR